MSWKVFALFTSRSPRFEWKKNWKY